MISRALLGLLLLTAATACTKRAETAHATAVVPFEHRFAIAVGSEAVQMRLAVHGYEQQRGLMFVNALPEDEGMLFIYERPQRMSFWMRNTRIALDIGFFDSAGVLREVRRMYPHVEDPVQSVGEQLRYALEVNEGWFQRHGVAPGAQIDRAQLRSALTARGLEASRFVSPD